MTTNLGATFEPEGETANVSAQEEPSAGEPQRGSWGKKAEFILASVGFAVGLGNVWRFPYLCQRNGGGAFLIPYAIFMIIEGFPLMIMEFALGQKMRMSFGRVWQKIHPAFFGIGICCISVSLFIAVYYIVVLAWCIFYFFMSMQKDLPWKGSQLCSKYPAYSNLKAQEGLLEANVSRYEQRKGQLTESEWKVFNASREDLFFKRGQIANFSDCCVIDPQQWYFYNNALDVSVDIEDYSKGLNAKLVGCFLLAWVVVYLCIIRGIKSTGKVVYFTAIFPYVILLVLFFRGVTLDGAGSGLRTFFTPDWSRLADGKVWRDAAAQIFFSLGLAFGTMISFSSYMPKNNQCTKDAYTVVLVNCGTSVFAGAAIFSILGFRELQTGIDAAKVGSGPGLAFMAFSDALLQLDVAPFWSILFFFMLILLGIDSEFGVLETTVAALMEIGAFPKTWRREVCTAIVCGVLFLIGLCMVAGNGFYVFQIFDDYSAAIPLIVIALFQCIVIAWVYGNDRFADDIEEMTGKRPWIGWMICWKYISPLALIILLISMFSDLSKGKAAYVAFVGCEQDPYTSKYPGTQEWVMGLNYPAWGQFLIALVIMCSTLPILVFLIYKWPKNWRSAFNNTFCSGINNYLPDPKRQ